MIYYTGQGWIKNSYLISTLYFKYKNNNNVCESIL